METLKCHIRINSRKKQFEVNLVEFTWHTKTTYQQVRTLLPLEIGFPRPATRVAPLVSARNKNICCCILSPGTTHWWTTQNLEDLLTSILHNHSANGCYLNWTVITNKQTKQFLFEYSKYIILKKKRCSLVKQLTFVNA